MENNQNISGPKKSTLQNSILIFMRIIIGWHFLYEGVVKLITPEWSAAGYLSSSTWIFSAFFRWLASDTTILAIVNLLNIWGTLLIGLALILGLFTRYASISGIMLLFLYYISNPSWAAVNQPTEGSYFIVNKNLIEMVALLIVAIFPAGSAFRLDLFIKKLFPGSASSEESKQDPDKISLMRRETLKYLASVPLLGGFAAGTWLKQSSPDVDIFSGATIKIKKTDLKDLQGELPRVQIKKLDISRMILGGNLIGGYAHARDLLYARELFLNYNTEKKILQTLMINEKCGVNSIVVVGWQMDVINKYNRLYDGNMQIICMVDSKKAVDAALEKGASAIYIIGNHCDWMVRDNKVDKLVDLLSYIKASGLPAGLGAHSIQALIACDDAGMQPDFFVKTLHHDNYWSAHPKENRIPFSVDTEKSPDHDKFHDNMFCLFPDQTIEFMQKKDVPWIAFKVLAGGAIHPQDGFKYAFENGADFICVGMFDFQVVDDVNIAIDTLKNISSRKRRWLA